MTRLAALERLRAAIARIEQRPALAGLQPQDRARPAPGGLPEAPAGLMHEVFADDLRNAGASLGFALGLARGLLGGGREAIVYLQLVKQSQETGLPYGAGLAAAGIDPGRFVLGRMEGVVELLWALEECVVCPAVAAVIADVGGHHKALDFTASRRLSLRAAAAGASVFFLRYGREREASAAAMRWRVEPHPSGERAFDPRAPGPPRFLIEIEKGRMGGRSRPLDGTRLVLDWTENGFVAVEPEKRLPVPGAAALPRALPPALGDRLSQAG